MGYAVTTYHQDEYSMLPVIGFDMGGTSTDVSRYDGDYEHVFESTTAGVCIQAPQVLMCICLHFTMCMGREGCFQSKGGNLGYLTLLGQM